MKVFFDSNVIIDVFTNREQGHKYSVDLYREVAAGRIIGCLSSKQITDIFYILRKYVSSDDERKEVIRILLETFTIFPLLPSQLKLSLTTDMKNYEDSILDQCCSTNCVNFLVTNNINDYVYSKSIAFTPKELCNVLHLL